MDKLREVISLEINSFKIGKTAILEVAGRLDANTAPAMEKELLDLLDRGESNLLVDLANLNYISSVGLRILLAAAKKANPAGGKVAICSLQEYVQEIFAIAGFTTIFEIYPTRDEALQGFSG